MKKVYSLFLICTIFVCALSFCPVSAFQEDSFDDNEYEKIGSLGLGHLISDGQIDELDFTNGSGDVGFLVALGKSIVTKDPTYILEYGLNWATAKAQEILQSLEDWFSLNFPNLYEFFTGVETKIEYHPMPLETRKGFTHLLKNRVDTTDPVQPQPDSNYALYLQLINGMQFNSSGQTADFWLGTYNRSTSNTSGSFTLDANPTSLSWVTNNRIFNPTFFGGSSWDQVSSLQSLGYYMNNVIASDPITIYLNSEDNITYVLTTTAIDSKYIISNGFDNYKVGQIHCDINNNRTFDFYYSNISPNTSQFLYQGSLEDCFKIIALNFRNVDIYVNGNLWSIGNYDPDDSIIYPIGIPDNFEILNGVQGGYYYPTDSYWNLNELVQLIKQAITEYGVISINDIAPLIVDINGVQAVRTTNIARTDYDNLISEQYTVYPDDTVLQVPSVVLDNGEIIFFVATSSGSDIIPDDIMLVLCGGGILLLIGYMINRMLE